MFREMAVNLLVALVQDDEEEIEAGHNRCGHVDIGAESCLAIIAASDWVGGREDGGARVKGGLDTGFGDGDGLLLHGFMDGDLVGQVHLVKLVDGADAVVGEHESAGFNGVFALRKESVCSFFLSYFLLERNEDEGENNQRL